MRVYVAGPMRGLPDYNFPAFDEAAERGRRMGHEVISPADLDREIGFDEKHETPTAEGLQNMIIRDVVAVASCDAIALLPGWERSSGVKVEFAIASFLGLEVLDAETFQPIDYTIKQIYYLNKPIGGSDHAIYS